MTEGQIVRDYVDALNLLVSARSGLPFRGEAWRLLTDAMSHVARAYWGDIRSDPTEAQSA